MRIYCCQFDIAWEDRSTNESQIAAMLRDAKPRPGSLVLLPEMCLSGFSLAIEQTASDDDAFFSKLCKELDIYLMAGVVRLAPDGRGINQAVTFTPTGDTLNRYNKLHPFSFANEHTRFAPGSEIETFQWEQMPVSPFVCYDLRFPEVFRLAVDRGAKLITVIANWPASRQEHWTTLLKARAIENQCYVAACNRVGSDPNVGYAGGSLIVDPRGQVLAQGDDTARIIHAEISTAYVDECRAKFPALQDKRFI